MTECAIPYRCEACGHKGTVKLDLSRYPGKKEVLYSLFITTLEDHCCAGISRENGMLGPLLSLFWDFPECWSKWEPSTKWGPVQ